MPRWTPFASEPPPCSPQQAIALAEEYIRSHLTPNPTADWLLERFELRALPFHSYRPSPGCWFWVVIHHLCRKGPSSGVWPYFRLLVGMDGVLIQPAVTDEDPPWDARERRWDSYIMFS